MKGTSYWTGTLTDFMLRVKFVEIYSFKGILQEPVEASCYVLQEHVLHNTHVLALREWKGPLPGTLALSEG